MSRNLLLCVEGVLSLSLSISVSPLCVSLSLSHTDFKDRTPGI